MDEQHGLVSAVKELAIELGRTPTRTQLELKVCGFRRRLERAFNGSYTALVAAAGLDQNKGAVKINNTVFERPIERHLEEYVPREVINRGDYPSIAVISDLHYPFSNQRVIDAFLKHVGEAKPEWVVLAGDAWDMYSHAKFPRSHNLFTPREEMAMSRQMNETFWKEVRARAPQAECVQCLGNHDVRPLKRALEVMPGAEDWIAEKMREAFTFEGVRTIYDAREELMIGDIAIFHGYRSQLGSHRDYSLYNTIVGHTHRGGAVFRRIRGATLWELNCGLAGDPEAKGLSYTPQRITEWTPGFGVVDKLGPRFVPV